MFSVSNKLPWFIVWIVCLVLLCTALIIIEYFHESLNRKSAMVDLSKDEMYQLLGDQLDREYFSSPIERLRQRVSNVVAEAQARMTSDAKPDTDANDHKDAVGAQTTLVLRRLINERDAEPEVEVPTIVRGGIVTAPAAEEPAPAAEEAEPVSAEATPADVDVPKEPKAKKDHHGHKKHDKTRPTRTRSARTRRRTATRGQGPQAQARQEGRPRMRRIWRIFCLDVKHATKNIIALIVCIGLVVIPSLYAWFNIAGSWDPYGNTGNLKVAVANSDEGYQSDTIPVKINLGERVASDLSQKTTIGYVVTTEDDAVEGVRSGKYYAAIVIPEDFTKDMLTVFSDDIQQATIVYYSNQKENAIAPIVTDKAATSVKNSIQTDFAQSLGEMGAGALSEISGYVSDDQLMDISKNLSDAISRASTDLRTVSAHMGVYSSLLSSAGSIIDSSSTLLSGTDSSTQDVRERAG
jgi:YhgE/Pip-like protein